MNIVTQRLLQGINDQGLRDFVSHWDILEALVVNVYRTNYAIPEDEEQYSLLRGWFTCNYPEWEDALRPHWEQVYTANEPLKGDPFKKLLAFERASDFTASWNVMQTLPAAREALNSLLLSIIEVSK